MTLRYRDYREITAKYDGEGCKDRKTGPHPVKKGDRIGYARPRRRGPTSIVCAECWRTWSFEVRDEESMEAGFGPTMY